MVLYSRKGGTKKKQRYEKLITKYRKRRQKRTRNRDFYKLETRSKAPSKYRTRRNNKSFNKFKKPPSRHSNSSSHTDDLEHLMYDARMALLTPYA